MEESRALVAEAEAAGDTVILVEIDPREGSGVVPRDWLSLLRPKGERETSAPLSRSRGTSVPKLRKLKGLAGVMPRDYDYDVFWVVFSLVSESGEALFPSSAREAELVVRIHDKEGRVHWPIPESIRERSRAIAARRKDQGAFFAPRSGWRSHSRAIRSARPNGGEIGNFIRVRQGPVIVETPATTIVVPPDAVVTRAPSGSLILDLVEGGPDMSPLSQIRGDARH